MEQLMASHPKYKWRNSINCNSITFTKRTFSVRNNSWRINFQSGITYEQQNIHRVHAGWNVSQTFSCSPRQMMGRPMHIQDARIDENGCSSCDRHVCPIVTKMNIAEQLLVKPVNMTITKVRSAPLDADGRTDGTNLMGVPPGSKCMGQ